VANFLITFILTVNIMTLSAIYRDFLIYREDVGRTPGTRYRYVCGRFIAPRLKDVKAHIDALLCRRACLELEIYQLSKTLKL
jgi:hypothetical protein